jgi:3'5'-cyclic nucleotide phosphodiesterase
VLGPPQVLPPSYVYGVLLTLQFYYYSTGITSDPLTQFAVVLSALIHDVDHTGAPNAQLIKEGASIASIYSGKSVAEQNSIDLAWSLLVSDTVVWRICIRTVVTCTYTTLSFPSDGPFV